MPIRCWCTYSSTLFGDALFATAMDRLLHHSHFLVLDGRSFRTARRSA